MLFMAKVPDKCEQQKGLHPTMEWVQVWYTNVSNSNKGMVAEVYRWGLRRGHKYRLWALHHGTPS
jgi:hypothetical protein